VEFSRDRQPVFGCHALRLLFGFYVKGDCQDEDDSLYDILIGDINSHQVHSVGQRHDHESADDGIGDNEAG
jgi:hypothetical protein